MVLLDTFYCLRDAAFLFAIPNGNFSEKGGCKFLNESLVKGMEGREPGTSRKAVLAVLALIVQGMIIRFLCVNKNAGEHLS